MPRARDLPRFAPPHRTEGTVLTTFRDLGVLPETADALEAVGIIEPFPIQQMTLPVALAGTDIIGQAKTGTGKTLGFGIPLLQRITVPADASPDARSDDGRPQALVVVPTRELCLQVCGDLETAGKTRGVRVVPIYGGRAYEPQVDALRKGVDVVVGTPGRLLDLAGQRRLDLSRVRVLVLDEADEMLDLGFLPDVEKIVTMLPVSRQTMLFSATMPGQVIALARRYMSRPTHIRATDPTDEGATVASVEQHVFRAHALDKTEMLARLLQVPGRGLALVFCRTKRTAAKVAEELADRGFASAAVHGDLGQGAREQALRAFRNGKVDVLVATDVAARGIDVENVTHVVNFQCPEDEKVYLHRIGRTARAGRSGTAVTFVDWDDVPRWLLINQALGLDFHEPPETYSTSGHFFNALAIPSEATGILPRAERVRAGLGAEELEDVGETGRRSPRQRAGESGHAGGGRGRRERAAPTRRSAHGDDEPAPGGEAPSADGAAPRASRRSRGRRRLRGGVPVHDGVSAGADGASPAEDAPADGTGHGRAADGEDRLTPQPPQSSPPQSSPPQSSPPQSSPPQSSSPQSSSPQSGAEDGGRPQPRRRRRNRRGAAIPIQQQTEDRPLNTAVGSEAPTTDLP